VLRPNSLITVPQQSRPLDREAMLVPGLSSAPWLATR